MASQYIAILLFVLFSLFLPVSLILTSKMLRGRSRQDPVGSAPYESAETSSGSRLSIMNEYMHYFPMFIFMEVIGAVLIIWSPIVRGLPSAANVAIISLVIVAFVFEMLVVLMVRSRVE